MLEKTKKHLVNYRFPILSGILIGTSYIPFPPWALLFCFAPLWLHWLKTKTWQQIWWSGWVTQFTFTLIGFNWVAHTVKEFGHIPAPLNFLVLMLYCGFANLQLPLSGLLWFFAQKKFKLNEKFSALWLPAFYLIAEMSFPQIFDWHFGYTWLWLGWPAYQLGEWIGFHGLSLISIFLNLFPLFMVLHWRKARTKIILGCSLLALVIGLNLVGFLIEKQLPSPDQTAHVAIIQANIGNLEKEYAEQGRGFRDHILSKYLHYSAQAIAEFDNSPQLNFLIWPETAFPESIGSGKWSDSLTMQLRTFFMQKQVPLITGAYGFRGENKNLANSIFIFDRKGFPASEEYSKNVLLAFGEYFPGADWIPFLRDLVPEVGDFARGRGPHLIEIENLRLGPLICYEGLFAWMSRDLANQGAQLLVNVTNDSWYGAWQQPYQHLYMTMARAIEVRRPLIRATNTGISSVVLASGSILTQSPLQKEWYGLYEIPFQSEPRSTFYQGLGYYFSWAWISFWILIILGINWRARIRTS